MINSNIILKNDNTIWGCGYNEYGQLGLGHTDKVYAYNNLNMDDIKSIFAGKLESQTLFIIKNDGTLWATGNNEYGQLGLGDAVNRSQLTKVDIDNVQTVYNIAAYSTYILKKDGTLWACGRNTYGQLGLGDTDNRSTFTKVNIDNISSITVYTNEIYVLKNDGTVWSCGYNAYGQLGLGDTTNRSTFTKVDIDDVNELHMTGYTAYVLKNDGTLWATGQNNYGQLGLGDTTNRTTFTNISITDIKYIHTDNLSLFVLKNDNTLWACGYNYYGQLGTDDKTAKNKLVQISTDVKGVYSAGHSTFIIKTDDTLWGTGRNGYGNLGLGNNNDKRVFTAITGIDNIDKIYVENSKFYTMVLKTDGTLWVCGQNNYGQLGINDSVSTTVNTFTLATDNVSAVVDGDYTLKTYEKPKYELVDITIKSHILVSENRVLLKMDDRFKVFKYLFSSNVSVYYSLTELDINSELAEWNYDDRYTKLNMTLQCEPYIAKYILLVFDSVVTDVEFEILAEIDNRSISIGKISNENLNNITNDITTNLYVTEEGCMHINDMGGNYVKLNGIAHTILFDGSISTIDDYTLGDLTQYKMFNFILSDGSVNVSKSITKRDTELFLELDTNNIVFNLDDTTLHVTSITGLSILRVIGIN